MKTLGRIWTGFLSLLIGMGVTLRRSLKRNVTLQYPHAKPVLSAAYRSCIKLKRFDDTGSHDCVACGACERVCPSFCIKVTGGKVDGIKKKRADFFEVDFALCSLCGLCLDACPTDTLEYSRFYDEAGYSPEWKYDLLADYSAFEPTFVAEQQAREEAEAAEKAAKAAAAKAAKAKPAAGDDGAKPAKGESEAGPAEVAPKEAEA